MPRPVTRQAARYDPAYVRGGVAQLFWSPSHYVAGEHVTVGARRTRLEFAACIKALVDVHYPDAERIVLVMDQLNTHSTASLYAAFPPAEARRWRPKLEIHHTPNMELAEHGGVRAERAGPAVSAPTPARRGRRCAPP